MSEVECIKKSEMDYRLSKMMVDYLFEAGFINDRERKLTNKRLLKHFEPILGTLETEHGK